MRVHGVEDEHYMQLALDLAELGRYQTMPNPMVGAVVVNQGEIVGQGAHLKAGGPHAEVHALRMAGDKARGGTIYVTLEPCSHHGRTPPCADAVIAAGIQRVVIASVDQNPLVGGNGIARLRDVGLEVVTGILEHKALRLNEMFFTSMRHRRPFVVWKCASTLDGYIATHTGHSTYVTSEASRQDVQQLRRSLPAIAVGIGTVLADDPRLTVRDVEAHQPLRVVFDSRLRFPKTAKMLDEPGETLIYTVGPVTENVQSEMQQSALHGPLKNVEIVSVPENGHGRIDLSAALKDLFERGISGVLVEGGSTLVAGLVRDRLIDKVVYYVAPRLLGGGIPSLKGLDPNRMGDALELRDISWSTIGSDLRMEAYPDWR